ncbi:MAG: hypothetical protein J2P31_11645 [Blastocatellia bacterium]|nr:hypothetical protein [Blastocatellia bacterium]
MAQSIRKQPNDDPLLSAGIAGQKDPYRLEPDDVIEPPQTISASLRRIGPGMILAASIVGSGELIGTTTLGAQVDYTALWVIILIGYERIERLAMIKEVF